MLIEKSEDWQFYDRVRYVGHLASKIRSETGRTRYGDDDINQIDSWVKYILSNDKRFEYGSLNKLKHFEKSLNRIIASVY